MDSLVRWNTVAAVAHLTAAILSGIFLKAKTVTLYEIDFDATSPGESDIDFPQQLAPSSTVNIKNLVILFFAFTAVAHVIYATDFFGAGWYSSAVLGFGWNPYRWFEYSVSAAVMLYIIAVIAGSKEKSAALTVALITPGLMLQGLTTERELHQNLDAGIDTSSPEIGRADPIIVWANFAPAWILYAVKWYIIFNALLTLQRDVKDQLGRKLNPRVTELVILQFVFFTMFGLVQTQQVWAWFVRGKGRGGKAAQFIQYEKAYIALSLIAKVALGVSVARVLG